MRLSVLKYKTESIKLQKSDTRELVTDQEREEPSFRLGFETGYSRLQRGVPQPRTSPQAQGIQNQIILSTPRHGTILPSASLLLLPTPLLFIHPASPLGAD